MVSNGFPLIQDSSSGNAIQIGSPEESVRGEGVRFSDSLSFRFLVSPSYLLMFVIFFWFEDISNGRAPRLNVVPLETKQH